ncbi:hypothetical protein J6590_063107 [Homalodisca vitripennis]|nr:hypothetical protein J6590_063107 [Homalodisca vitripennis]
MAVGVWYYTLNCGVGSGRDDCEKLREAKDEKTDIDKHLSLQYYKPYSSYQIQSTDVMWKMKMTMVSSNGCWGNGRDDCEKLRGAKDEKTDIDKHLSLQYYKPYSSYQIHSTDVMWKMKMTMVSSNGCWGNGRDDCEKLRGAKDEKTDIDKHLSLQYYKPYSSYQIQSTDVMWKMKMTMVSSNGCWGNGRDDCEKLRGAKDEKTDIDKHLSLQYYKPYSSYQIHSTDVMWKMKMIMVSSNGCWGSGRDDCEKLREAKDEKTDIDKHLSLQYYKPYSSYQIQSTDVMWKMKMTMVSSNGCWGLVIVETMVRSLEERKMRRLTLTNTLVSNTINLTVHIEFSQSTDVRWKMTMNEARRRASSRPFLRALFGDVEWSVLIHMHCMGLVEGSDNALHHVYSFLVAGRKEENGGWGKDVSSANKHRFPPPTLDEMSLTNNRNKTGPRTEPWGTPDFTVFTEDTR